jgi:hypothetical protein
MVIVSDFKGKSNFPIGYFVRQIMSLLFPYYPSIGFFYKLRVKIALNQKDRGEAFVRKLNLLKVI